MAQVYIYKAKDRSGKLLEGTLEGENERVVVARLKARNYLVLEVKPKPLNLSLSVKLDIFEKKVSIKDLSLFCRQFATMLDAGIPILTCLEVLGKQTENKKLKIALKGVIEKLENGESLAESVKAYPKIFPELFINMMEVGEVGGILNEVLERLADTFEKDHEITEKVKSALTMPGIVLVIAILAVAILMTFVIPTFSTMLTDFGVELPLPTKMVMATSQAFQSYWYLILSAVMALVFGIQRYIRTERGRTQFDQFLLKSPVFGQLITKMIVSRFSRNLATLIRSGVPMIQALDVIKNTVGNKIVSTAVAKAQENIRDGQGLAGPLEQANVFPPMVIQMIEIGEESGALDSLLEKISYFYDKEVDTAVGRLSTMIEPILMVGMGGVVGFIILSIMLPMFSMMNAVQ